jgi:hypothetical protein
LEYYEGILIGGHQSRQLHGSGFQLSHSPESGVSAP